jgi:photosystem II reaction center protein PsbP
MNSIARSFKKFDEFLTNSVTYFGTRVITGKFIADIFILLSVFIKSSAKRNKKIYITLKKSPTFAFLIESLEWIIRLLLKVPFVNVILILIAEAVKIIIFCYSEIFIVFAITFPLSILLLDWFQTSIVMFCFALIPTVIVDIVCISALFYCIDRREVGDRISIWEGILFILRHLYSVCFPLITESAIILESFLVFIMIALSLTFLFDLLKIPLGNSVFYWLIVILSGSLMVILAFILTILLPQTYFYVLLDHIPFHQALESAKRIIRKSLFWYLFLYILLYIFCGLFVWNSVVIHLYLGLTVGLYVTIISGIFLGFLLRKIFFVKPVEAAENNHALYLLLNTIIIFGLINYLLISVFLIKEYQPVLRFVQKEQDNYLASQEVKTYTNERYSYSIRFPWSWSFYQWQANSVTFYNNYTRTLTGGTWMTITVTPAKGSNFNQFYNASPGIIPNTNDSKNITTKITNTTIQGYQTVNYLLVKPGLPYTEYESHYIILKGGSVYDISFTSVTNDVSSYNSDLFQKIINSFRFIQ